LTFYRNTGTHSMPEWVEDNTVFTNIRLDTCAMPTLVDMDFDNDFDLILGDISGRFYSFRNDVTTSVDDESSNILPQQFQLYQNYPNPFNMSTSIRFSISKNTHVSLTIYTITGKEVTRLIDKQMSAGDHNINWNGKDRSGRDVASGVYFFRLRCGDLSKTRKAALLR